MSMMRTDRLMNGVCALALAALGLAGCAPAQARTVPEGPPLDVPAPPPREVAVLEIEPPPPPVLPVDEPEPPTPPRPRPAPPRPDAAKPEPPSEPPRPAAEPSRAPTTLQTTPAGAEGELEREIREALARAAADLARIDYRKLNPDARSQYYTAKRFSQQAEEAVRAKNLLFAKNLADKSALLAAQLAGR
jgi:hypothetical protein